MKKRICFLSISIVLLLILTSFTNFFGRVYQARYLSGIITGMQTKTNKIGFVAAWETDNSGDTLSDNEVRSGISWYYRTVNEL